MMSPKPVFRRFIPAAWVAVILMLLSASAAAKHASQPHESANVVSRNAYRRLVAKPHRHFRP